MQNVLRGRLQRGDVACRLLLAGAKLGGELIHLLLHQGEAELCRLELQQFG